LSDFFIKQTRIDPDRCKLYRDGEILSLEPRVIQVLQHLARHQGEVVSQKTLMDSIWTNTVVEASALQRCIVQLRKAFGDDARNPQVIVTYPKKGYSLIAPVSWHAPEVETGTVQSNGHFFRSSLSSGSKTGMLLVLVVSVVRVAIAFYKEQPGETKAFAALNQQAATATETSLLSNTALITAIGAPDDFPVYSPDGRFVVYPRYLEENKAHLWARDLAYGKDFLLTDEVGDYEHLAWSPDGSQLVFVDSSCDAGTCAYGQCSSLKSVAMSQSETNTLSVEKLIHCSPERLFAPEWLNNREIAVIEMSNDAASLKRYDLKTQNKSSLYQSDEIIPYQLSFSRQTNILTITAMNLAGKKELLFLDISNGAINRNDTSAFVTEETWYPSSTPL